MAAPAPVTFDRFGSGSALLLLPARDRGADPDSVAFFFSLSLPRRILIFFRLNFFPIPSHNEDGASPLSNADNTAVLLVVLLPLILPLGVRVVMGNGMEMADGGEADGGGEDDSEADAGRFDPI